MGITVKFAKNSIEGMSHLIKYHD